MIMYRGKGTDSLHFGNKEFSSGWGSVCYLYDGGFHDGRGYLNLRFDEGYLCKNILADHPLVNWNDNIDSLF